MQETHPKTTRQATRFTWAPLALAAMLVAVPAVADAAPTTGGATRALERHVEKRYRTWVRDGGYALAYCKKRKTTKREIRYRCSWQVTSGDGAAMDGYNEGRYGSSTPSGGAWVYANRYGRTSYKVVLLR